MAGAPAGKPARLVGADEPIVVHGPPARFVGRGGEKLEAALDGFAISVDGLRALDAGASTGGFTDCLLQRGAREVVAVDVGYGQLHERLRADDRVRNVERTNIRQLDPTAIGGPVDVVVGDLSFISLRLVAAKLVEVARPGAAIVVLVKPQFEAGKAEASKGKGVITDPIIWRRVLVEVIAAVEEAGAIIMGCMVSPITGSDGNVEFLLHARTAGPDVGSAGPIDLDVNATLDAVIADALEIRGGRA